MGVKSGSINLKGTGDYFLVIALDGSFAGGAEQSLGLGGVGGKDDLDVVAAIRLQAGAQYSCLLPGVAVIRELVDFRKFGLGGYTVEVIGHRYFLMVMVKGENMGHYRLKSIALHLLRLLQTNQKTEQRRDYKQGEKCRQGKPSKDNGTQTAVELGA